MTYSAAATVIGTHLTAAGAAASPPFTDIARGERLSNSRRIDYWYLGSGSPDRFPTDETLADALRSERVQIRVVIPVVDRSAGYSATLEDELQAIGFDIRKRLYGDANLGGNCIAIDPGHAKAGWVNFDGAWGRTVEIEVGMDFADDTPITL